MTADAYVVPAIVACARQTHEGVVVSRYEPQRQSRIAHMLLTLLGEAGEKCGLDRTLKSNTRPKRQLSLYNQGIHWYMAIPSHLRELVREFTAHYHAERNHQGLGNKLIIPMSDAAATGGRVARHQRLGGVLNFYHREAA